jgi:K+-sensing histidine kinase KdpD
MDAELEGVQFITMFPAIIATTLICGLRAGTFALILAKLCSWYFIIPPVHSFKIDGLPHFFALLFFIPVGGAIVVAIGGIRILLEHVSRLSDTLTAAFEFNPDAILLTDRHGRMTRVNQQRSKCSANRPTH